MKLTTSESSLILNQLLKTKGISSTQALARLKADTKQNDPWCEDFANEYNAIAMLYGRSKLSVRGNKTFTQMRKELSKAMPKLSPKQRFKLDAKTKNIEHLTPLLEKKLSNKEAVVLYSHTTKHCGQPLDVFTVERTFLMQDGHLVSLARKYCKSIGLVMA